MFVSGLETTIPVFKDSYAIPWNLQSILPHATGDCKSYYSVCNSCAVIARSSLEHLKTAFTHGLEIVEVEEFPMDLTPYTRSDSSVECIEFGGVKLVLRFRK